MNTAKKLGNVLLIFSCSLGAQVLVAAKGNAYISRTVLKLITSYCDPRITPAALFTGAEAVGKSGVSERRFLTAYDEIWAV